MPASDTSKSALSTIPDDAATLADGRARLYTLLARLAHGPPTRELAPWLDAWPDLAATTPPPEQAATRYESILGAQVPPYAGLFCNDDAMLGGALAHTILEFYSATGYRLAFTDAEGEHLANLLGCLAHLCAAESDAWQDQLAPIARQITQLQRRLLDEHLLTWLPAIGLALARSGDAFYAAYADLLLHALDAHRATLPFPADTAQLRDLPAASPVPDAADADMRAITAFLSRPHGAGIYLTAADLQHLGHQLNIAPGFGPRSRRLTTLLEAVPLTELPSLLQRLAQLAQAWDTGYRDQMRAYPALAPFIAPWRTRTQATHSLLREMHAMASHPQN